MPVQRNTTERAGSLMKSMPPRSPTPDRRSPQDQFRELAVERSRFTNIVVRNVTLALMPFLAALFFLVFGSSSDLGSDALVAIGDSRWATDYRATTASWIAPVGEETLMVATRGGGVHRLRTDSGRFAIWRHTRSKDTPGLKSDDITGGFASDDRLYFVGAEGWLSSSDKDLQEWQVHLGGAEFRPDLDLSVKATAFAMAPDQSFFVVGTREDGLGAYDLRSRQWVTPREKAAPKSVTALLVTPRSILVGTTTGVVAFDWERRADEISLIASDDWEPLATTDEVHRLQLIGPESGLSVACALGHGGLFTAPLSTKDWQEVVGQGDPRLRQVTDVSETIGMVSLEGQSVFVVSGVGVLKYDAAKRHLGLFDAGLPPPSDGMHPSALESSKGGDGTTTAWLVTEGGALFRSAGEVWSPAADGVKNIAFAGTTPVARRRDGSLEELEAHGAYLVGIPGGVPRGPSAVSGSAMIVGRGKEILRYSAPTRSWEQLPTQLESDVVSLSAAEQVLAIATASGEVGILDLSLNSKFAPVIGATQVPAVEAPVRSVAQLGGKTWFVRSDVPYEYDMGRRTVRGHGTGLPTGLSVQQLRATEKSLYLTARSNWTRELVALKSDGQSDWKDAIESLKWTSGLKQTLATKDALHALHKSGSIAVLPDSGEARQLLQGQGRSDWAKLAALPAGDLVGLTTSGDLIRYQSSTGSWLRMDGGCRDFVVRTDEAGTTLLAGCGSLLKQWSIGANEITKGEHDIKLDVAPQRMVLSESVLWVFGGSPGEGASVARVEDETVTKWAFAVGHPPPSQEWQDIRWAGFVDRYLWWLSNRALWKYNMETREWTEIQVPSLSGLSVQRTSDGSFWWLDTLGRLHGLDVDSGRTKELTDFKFSAGTARTWVGILRIVEVLVASVAALAVLLSFLRVAVWLLRAVFVLTISACLWAARACEPTIKTLGDVFFFLPLKRWTASALNPWETYPRPPGLVHPKFLFTLAGFSLVATALVHVWLPLRVEKRDILMQFDSADFNQVCSFDVGHDALTVRTTDREYTFDRSALDLVPVAVGIRDEARELAISAARCREHDAFGGEQKEQLQVDETGDWRLEVNGNSYVVAQRTADGKWVDLKLGNAGWTRDQVSDFAVEGGEILALTAAGFARFRVDGKRLSLVALDGSPAQTQESLRTLDGVIWRLGAGQPARRYHDGRWQSTEPGPPLGSTGDIQWRRDYAGDSLIAPAFDSGEGRFRDDIAVRLGRDAQGNVWVATLGNWRMVRRTGSDVLLEKAAAPKLEPFVDSFEVSDTWWARVEEQPDGEDKALFENRQTSTATSDPFHALGRFPDERVNGAAVFEGELWLATEGGVRRVGGSVDLPTFRTTELRAIDGKLFAQTDHGPMRRERDAWVTTFEDVFPAQRDLFLPVARGIVAHAVQRVDGGKMSTELDDFDDTEGRFEHDRVFEMRGYSGGLVADTPRGIQTFSLQDGVLSEPRLALPGVRSLAIREHPVADSCVVDAHKRVWLLAEGEWRLDASANPADPCKGRSGMVSGTVRFETHFAAGGDRVELRAAGEPLRIQDGKFSTDFVTSVVAQTDDVWEVTRGGVLRRKADTTELLPWKLEPGRVARSPEGLVYHHAEQTLRYDEDQRQWIPTDSRAANREGIRYEAGEWRGDVLGPGAPFLSADRSLTLNDRGQFQFDHAKAVTGNGDTLWVLSEAEMTRRGAGFEVKEVAAIEGLDPTCAQQLRYLPDGAKVAMRQTCAARVADVILSARDLVRLNEVAPFSFDPFSWRWSDPNRVIEPDGTSVALRVGENRRTLTTPAGIIAALGTRRHAWFLTPEQLYGIEWN